MKLKYYKYTTFRRIADEKGMRWYNTGYYTGSTRMFGLAEWLYQRERAAYAVFRELDFWGKIKYFLR